MQGFDDDQAEQPRLRRVHVEHVLEQEAEATAAPEHGLQRGGKDERRHEQRQEAAQLKEG